MSLNDKGSRQLKNMQIDEFLNEIFKNKNLRNKTGNKNCLKSSQKSYPQKTTKDVETELPEDLRNLFKAARYTIARVVGCYLPAYLSAKT